LRAEALCDRTITDTRMVITGSIDCIGRADKKPGALLGPRSGTIGTDALLRAERRHLAGKKRKVGSVDLAVPVDVEVRGPRRDRRIELVRHSRQVGAVDGDIAVDGEDLSDIATGVAIGVGDQGTAVIALVFD